MSERKPKDAMQLYRAQVRKAVRQAPWNKSERDVLLAILALYWARNKDMRSGRGLGVRIEPIHPGIDAIARRAEVSHRTCQRAIKMMIAQGTIRVVSHEKGGRHAQRWIVDFIRLLSFSEISKHDAEAFRRDIRGVSIGTPEGCQYHAILAPGIDNPMGYHNTGLKNPDQSNVVAIDSYRSMSDGQ